MVVPMLHSPHRVAVSASALPSISVADTDTLMLLHRRMTFEWRRLRRAVRYAPEVVLAFAVTASVPLVF